ncbi:MAG: hypothetical protein JWN03_4752 [Nocardia sp.]|nr:hypothetical protein [Nocardia sp.]
MVLGSNTFRGSTHGRQSMIFADDWTEDHHGVRGMDVGDERADFRRRDSSPHRPSRPPCGGPTAEVARVHPDSSPIHLVR